MGTLEEKVYANDLDNNVELLKQKITEAVEDINEQTIHLVFEKFRKRIEKCVEVGGQHVE